VCELNSVHSRIDVVVLVTDETLTDADARRAFESCDKVLTVVVGWDVERMKQVFISVL
jgi:hypothetical protein